MTFQVIFHNGIESSCHSTKYHVSFNMRLPYKYYHSYKVNYFLFFLQRPWPPVDYMQAEHEDPVLYLNPTAVSHDSYHVSGYLVPAANQRMALALVTWTVESGVHGGQDPSKDQVSRRKVVGDDLGVYIMESAV